MIAGSLFLFVFAGALYALVHFLGHGPLLIYQDQWSPDPSTYARRSDLPPVPNLLRAAPLAWTVVLLIPLVYLAQDAQVGLNSTQRWLFLFCSGLLMGKLLFGITSSRESTRFAGWSLRGLRSYARAQLAEGLADLVFKLFFKALIAGVVVAVSVVPLLGRPLPYFMGPVAADGRGLPWIVFAALSIAYWIRWNVYLATLQRERARGRATARHFRFHLLGLLSFPFVMLYANTVYAYLGLSLDNFALHLPVVAGLASSAVADA